MGEHLIRQCLEGIHPVDCLQDQAVEFLLVNRSVHKFQRTLDRYDMFAYALSYYPQLFS